MSEAPGADPQKQLAELEGEYQEVQSLKKQVKKDMKEAARAGDDKKRLELKKFMSKLKEKKKELKARIKSYK